MKKIKTELKKNFPEIIFDEPLRLHTSFGIGGKADFFYPLTDAKKLVPLFKFIKKNKIPYFFLGKGSNVLFSDKGFRGIIIFNALKKSQIKGTKLIAESGLLISEIIKIMTDNDLSGLEPWTSLPGTVGGAVRGNAGCNGLETKDILESAEIFDPKSGKIKTLKTSSLKFKYRDSKIKRGQEIVISAVFKLKKRKVPKEEQKNQMNEIIKIRQIKQPFGLTCGSFFKNPNPKSPAGMLIDQVGLKGKTLGKAKISEKHGNFFLNTGGAKSSEIIKLAKLAKKLVKAKFGITLHEEVQILDSKGKISL